MRGLREQVAALHGHAAELERLGGAVERKFMAIGRSLQAQAELSGELVTASARLQSLATGAGADKPAMTEALELAQQMLDFTEENHRQTEALLGRMESYHEQIGRLLQEEHRVERILAPLRVIQTLFRIESAVLPVDVQMAFVALSGEIPKFEAKVREAFDQHSAVLTRTRDQIEGTAARLKQGSAEQAAAIAATRRCTGETLTELDRELAASREREAQLERIVREIDGEVGTVVVSLQYQDITRQKMEHVRAALGEILAREADGRQPADLAYLHQACRLEALQSKAIQEELDRAVSTLLSGVRGIGAKLGQIQECWPRGEFARASRGAENRVGVLRKALRQTGALVPRASAAAEEALQLLNSFGDVAATVAAAASDMAEDMRMIALNAQVQAAQAGEAGAGLLILAERTYLISEEIKVVTRSIGTEFAEAASQLSAALALGKQIEQSSREHTGRISAASARVEEHLESCRRETVEALGRIEMLLAKIEQETAAVLPELETDETFGEPLQRLHGDLQAIAEAVKTFAGSDAAPECDGAFEGVRRRYTMESERAVHAAAIGCVVASPSAGAPAAVPATAERPAPLAVAESGGAEPVPAAPLADNVELF